MFNFKNITATLALTLTSSVAFADGHAKGWSLQPALSNISFGSIKNEYNGESHHFKDISGTVSAKGEVNITLALGSVETMIDIRNERMREFVFKNAPSATLSAALDMDALNALGVGEATTLETSGSLMLLGTETELDANFFVMRLSDTQVMVTTQGMIMLDVEEAGLDGSIDKLQELAGLDSITRVSPVSMRLFFSAGS